MLEIIIANNSDKPIYEQIVQQIRNAILSGQLEEGEQLPSIRSLANDIRVSVITTKRAYADLENQGFIETVQGKGSFVTGGNKEYLREQRRCAVEDLLTQAIEESRSAQISESELVEMLETLLESQ